MSDDLYIEKVGYKPIKDLYWKSMSQKERDDAPYHAGPNGTYPLGPGCKHVDSALHLAKTGHGANPKAILANVERYARSHNCSIGDK